MKQQVSNKHESEVWFEKIERAVHRVRQRDGSLTESQALSQAIEEDPEARAVYEKYCCPKRDETSAGVDTGSQQRGARVYMRTPGPDGSPNGVLAEVAKLRSLTAGTDYDDEIEAVMRDYPNLSLLYGGDNPWRS